MKPQSCPGQYVLDGDGNMSGQGLLGYFRDLEMGVEQKIQQQERR